MSFDTSRWEEPVTRSDLANVCITTALALRAVVVSLKSIEMSDQKAVDEAVLKIIEQADDLSQTFDRLSGYSGENANND